MELEKDVIKEEYLELLSEMDWLYPMIDNHTEYQEYFLKDAKLKRIALLHPEFKELYLKEQHKHFQRT